MPRFKLTIEYDGTPFVGWQIQADGRSVQGELADAITRFCGEQVVVRGAGRTDSGVHARGQVGHVDLAKSWPPNRVRDAINFHLKPQPIAVLECELVDDEFDARFSRAHVIIAIASCRVARRLCLKQTASGGYRCHSMLQLCRTRRRCLSVGMTFTTFRSVGCQAKSPVKTLDRLDVSQHNDEIWIEASARSFLHHQVRSLAGALKAVGAGKWSRGDLVEALAACDRARCAPVAPAAGLYFMQVDYP